MKKNAVLLCCLLGLALAYESRGQPEVSIPMYHWITQNEVLLWQSSDDPDPITAMLDVGTGQWRVDPVERKASWQPIVNRIALGYEKQANSQDISEEQFWAFVLTKLRNEYNQVRWARQRRASVELYLLPLDPKNVKVAFLYGDGGGASRAIFDFTKDRNGRWTKGNQNLNLKQVLGIPDTPEALSYIFALGNQNPNTSPAQRWQDAWHRWIEDFLTGESVSHFMYKDERGQLRWLWQERLTVGSEMPVSFRRMPPAPPKIRESNLSTTLAVSQTGSFWSLQTLAIASLALVVIIFALYFRKDLLGLSNRLLQKLKGKPGASSRVSKDGKREIKSDVSEPFITKETINALHKVAMERSRVAFGNDAAFGALSSSLEWARLEYVDAAASQQLLHDVTAFKDKIIEDYQRGELEVTVTDRDKIGRWIILGRNTEQALAESEDLIIPTEVNARMGVPGSLQGDAWVTEWPRSLKAFAFCLEEGAAKREDLEGRLAASEERNRNAIKKKEEELNSKWKTRVSELEKTNEQQKEQHVKDGTDLKQAHLKIEELQNKLEKLQTEMIGARAEMEVAQSTRSVLQKKFDDLNDVKWLSRELRRWLQGYYAGRMNDNRESRGVAVLAALINFSLCQMCFSIVEDQPELKRLVAHNILLFTKLFEQRYGQESDFAQTHNYLNQIAPEVGQGIQKLDEKEMGGDTLDDPLFRGLLYWLKTDTGKNLSPFFIDLDRKKETLVYVTTS